MIGYSCAGIQVAALPAIASTYAIFVTITVVKKLWVYGLSKFVTKWDEADGFLAPILTNMCLSVFWSLLGVLFWLKGKKLRYWTKHAKVRDGGKLPLVRILARRRPHISCDTKHGTRVPILLYCPKIKHSP